MLGIRCLSITLSLALVIITGGVIGGLSITTGNRVTDQTKETGQRGLDATHKVCNDGFDSLTKAQQEGLGACFSSGRDNAEYLGGLLLEQVKQVIVTRMTTLLDAPLQAVQQVYDVMATLPPEELFDDRWWDKAHSRWIMHIWHAAQKRGVTQLQVSVKPAVYVDGVYIRKGRYHIDHPRTVGRSLDEYHHQFLLTDMPVKCYSGNTLSRTQCEAERCVWCTHNGGGAGYCGDPRRQAWDDDEAPWAPCKGGYTSTARGPKPEWAKDTLYLGHADDTGTLYIGSCGLDGGDEACGCAARDDFQRKLIDNNGTVKGWPLGRPPRPGTLERYQQLPRIGSYRRPDGSYPPSHSTDADTVLETGACQVDLSLSGATDLSGRQNGMYDRIGYTRWTPVGSGLATPLLSVNVFKAWTHHSLPVTNGQPHYVGYIGAALDTARFSSFMRGASLPPESRMYAVQLNPWTGPPNVCKDDFHGLLQLMRLSCSILEKLKAAMGLTCDSDLRVLSSRLAKHNYIWKHCPESCGRCPWTLTETVGDLVGATHGSAAIELPLDQSSYGSDGTPDLRALHVLNSSDPYIRGHGKMVLARPGHYESIPTAEVVPWSDENDLLWWTKVAVITMPSELELLKIYLVILVQRDQAMKTIDAATRIVQADINKKTAAVLSEVEERRRSTAAVIVKENKETEDEKERDFTLMYIVVAVCVAALMVVSVVFVHFTIAPLLVLEQEMADVAVMKLENIDRDRPLSKLGEVAQMQRSFLQMVRNLIEYRNYMPQSILCDDTDEEEEDGAMEESQNVELRKSTRSRSSSPGSRQSTALSCSQKSRVEAAQKKFAAGGEELRKRGVSFCAFNLSGWHSCLAEKGDAISAIHSDYLAKVIAKITVCKGIPDTFCGDRILGTFNGVKPCATHRAQAPQCATAFRKQMAVEVPDAVITSSVVSGDCKFGNMGCTGAKRFTFVGGTYTWAWALERFCISIGAGVVCDKWINCEAENALHTRIVAVVSFAKRSPSDLVVHQLLDEKTVGEDEWMYQLQEAAANDPHAALNRVAEATIEKRFVDAKGLLAEVDTAGGVPEAVLKLFQAAIGQGVFEATKLLYH